MKKLYVQKTLISLFTLLLVSIYSCGGGGGSDVPSTNMDASGGIVISSDNRAKITVPAGAVNEPVTLTIDPASGLQGNLGLAYNFGPDGISFAMPVSIAIQYNDGDVPQNINENDLVLALWSGTEWIPLTGSGPDAANNTISGETSHFSTYGIVPKQLQTNIPPTVNDFSFSVVANSTYNGVLTGNDADNDMLNYRFINTGSQGTATVTDTNAGTFVYIANTNASGTDTLTYVANDGESDSNPGAVTVNFTTQPVSYLLWISKPDWGSGVVLLAFPSFPSSINCGDDCNTSLVEGTQAVLLAVPTSGSSAVEWEGCDLVNGLQCTVNMALDRYITATFNSVIDAAVPQNDNNGIYALRWSCNIPNFCSPGIYRIQEADDEDFDIYSEYSFGSTGFPFSGAKWFNDKSDGAYCYRVSPAPSLNWSKPVCIVIDRLERVSVDFYGGQANGNSYGIHISPYGHSVVFSSEATNLVSGDDEGFRDIFFRDTDGGGFYRASQKDGIGGDGDSYTPVMTPDERYIAFYSAASNLVTNDNNGGGDYFVYDRTTRNIERVSINNSGQSPFGGSFIHALDISWNGRYVVFSTASDLDVGTDDINGAEDVYIRDREYGYTFILSKGLNDTPTVRNASNPVISGSTSRYIAYESQADNLVVNDNNNASDIFLYDMRTAATILVSTNASGAQANGESYNPSISADGRYVAFDSLATNLIANDTNNQRDVFVKDMFSGEVKRASESWTLVAGNRVTIEGDDWSYYPKISAKGDHVAFQSKATNLRRYDVNNVDDIYIKYLPTDTLVVANRVNSSSSDANDFSGGPAISAEGMYVGFMSLADNLLHFLSSIDIFSYNDTNEVSDVFLYSNKNSIMTPSPEDADDDTDGLSNIYELTVSFTLPFNIDTDNDGFSDKEEVDAQTDPLNPNDHP